MRRTARAPAQEDDLLASLTIFADVLILAVLPLVAWTGAAAARFVLELAAAPPVEPVVSEWKELTQWTAALAACLVWLDAGLVFSPVNSSLLG